MNLCDYGCGQEAKYQFKNGKWCCSKNVSQCPVIRKKQSLAKIGENNPRGMLGKHHAKETRKKQSEIQSGENNPRGMLGKHLSKETRKKQSEAKSGENHPMFGKHLSGETLEKLRGTHEERIKFTENAGYELLSHKEEYKNQFSKLWFRCPEGYEFPMRWDNFKAGNRCPECANKKHSQWMKMNGQTIPNYNPEGCKLIEEYGKEHDYNFQHAENGGEYHIKELGYWVDGYDKERNTVIEIDEKAHFDKNGNLSEKDILRQKEITDFLGCKFIRLKI